MGKIKIGILIPVKNIYDRDAKNDSFDRKTYYGFKYIINEIDKKKYDVEYISNSLDQINSVDFVLYSLTSYYDILNLVNDLKGKKITSKIVVGGAGLLNFSILYDYIDIACIGRAEGIINDILEYKELPNVWYKEKDPLIAKQYEVGSAKYTIEYKDYKENNIGCKCKCFFCQYGWKNELLQNTENYKSGYNHNEDTIKNLDYNVSAGYLLTAVDGISENTRYIVNKNIKDIDIVNKIEEFFLSKYIRKSIKIYCIVAYPFENKIDLSLFDLIKNLDRKSNKILNIFIQSTHFCPMPLTPMEHEGVNLYDYRKAIIRNKPTYKGDSIRLWWFGNQTTSFITALEECILFRGDRFTSNIIFKLLLNPQYQNANSLSKMQAIKKYIPKELYSQRDIGDKIIKYIKYPKSFDKAQQVYEKRKLKIYNEKIR